jgi:hypothetical protein
MNEPRLSVVDRHDWEARAAEALEQARSMRKGPERSEALRKASLLRVAADAMGLFFPKRGRPRK